jgi:hypothetical protein
MMAMRFLGCVAAVCLVTAVGCKSKSDGDSSGDGDGDGDMTGDGDGDGGASIGTVSGDRLQARFWSGGGIEWLESVYDSEFDTPCGFGVGNDGDIYCFPSNPPGTAYVDVVFSDENCTEMIGRSWDEVCTNIGPYATMEEPGDCYPRGISLFEVGAEVDLPETIYERDHLGNCLEGVSMGRTFEVTEIPLEELASISIEVVERSAELGVAMYVSEDGLRLPRQLHDLKLGAACGPQNIGLSGDRAEVCLGIVAYSDAGGHYGYADADCEAQVAATTQCADPAYIVRYAQVDGCYQTELHKLGKEVAVADVHQVGADACLPIENSYYRAYFELGDPLTTDDAPVVGRSRSGDTRLIAETYENGGRSIMSTASIWDSALEVYCSPMSVNGTTYCLPNNLYGLNAGSDQFADDECTVPLEYYVESSCYDSTYTWAGKWSQSSTCGMVELDAIFEIEYHEGDTIYRFDGENCVEETAQVDAVYFMAGTELDPADVFAQVTQLN